MALHGVVIDVFATVATSDLSGKMTVVAVALFFFRLQPVS